MAADLQVSKSRTDEDGESRFVILRHEFDDSSRRSHWDLMLAFDGSLRTWAVYEMPGAQLEAIVEALPDHRLDYLEYEGPISGGRGSVSRWDSGTFALERHSENEVVAIVRGQKLRGRIALNRLAGEAHRWRLVC